jgi:hypothetical protein
MHPMNLSPQPSSAIHSAILSTRPYQQALRNGYYQLTTATIALLLTFDPAQF